MNLTKIELLWSRVCPLNCSGCAMPFDAVSSEHHQGTIEQWERGIKHVRLLGCRFVAIYGAEPLKRANGLPEVIRAIYHEGMKATVITAFPNDPLMDRLFDETPLDSLTVSWDGSGADPHRVLKGMRGKDALARFSNRCRDLAVVATVTNENASQIPDMAREVNESGYWFLFDILHQNHGPASKCSSDGRALPPTREQVRVMAGELLTMKRKGAKIQASEAYLELLAQKYDGNPRNLWHCRKQSIGWLTIDSDGSILPCDDWQFPYLKAKIWDDLSVEKLAEWRNQRVESCAGCAWNTHFDAVKVAENIISIDGYVH